MGDTNQDRMPQQQNDGERRQAGQQNQQGETRQPQQQPDDRQQAQPRPKQNQQADRERRPDQGVDATDQNGMNKRSATGGNGDLRPDQTDDRRRPALNGPGRAFGAARFSPGGRHPLRNDRAVGWERDWLVGVARR
ncbi:hypothetical protein ACRAWD_05320 [Caulobacter segnis]